MIPGTFAYHRPKSVGEAVALLANLGEEARPLAGGHSLIPMMKLRLATPAHLVDLGAIAELKGIQRQGSNLVIGAMTTQAELVASKLLADTVPILKETSLVIADPQVRYVGTIGGNVANGDPGNDMPAVMMSLDADYRVASKRRTRTVKARDFYKGSYTTALAPGEIVTAIEIPVPPAGHGFAYEKLKRKIGDYATAAAAVVLTVASKKVKTCAIALTNLGDTPLYAKDASAAVVGTSLDAKTIVAAAAKAGAIMSPASDAHGPAEYRSSVGGIMIARALQRAFARASG